MLNMTRVTVLAAASVMFISAGAALAGSPFYMGDGEMGGLIRSSEYRTVNSQFQRVDESNRSAPPGQFRGAARIGDRSADGLWEYLGDNDSQGWEIRPHSYGVQHGRVVHTDGLINDARAANAGLTLKDVQESSRLSSTD